MSGGWPGRLALGLAVTLVTAALTHLTAVLALPGRGTGGAYALLATAVRDTSLQTVPLGDKEGVFVDPAVPRAACLYDLRQGPVSVSFDMSNSDDAVLSVHDRQGRVLAGLTSRSARNGRLGFLLAELRAEPARHPDDGSSADLRIEVAEPRGFVLAEVVAANPSQQASAEAIAATLSCRPDGH